MKKILLSIVLGSSLLIVGKTLVAENIKFNDINLDNTSFSDTIEITNNKLEITNIYRDAAIEYVEFNNGIILAHDYKAVKFIYIIFSKPIALINKTC